MWSARAALRYAIVAQWVCVIGGLVLSFSLENSLPGQLRNYLRWQDAQEMTRTEVVLLPIVAALLLGAVISSVGLWLLKSWARWLYLATDVVGVLVVPFLGPTVEHGLSSAVDEVAVMLNGVVLGLAFFGKTVVDEQPPNQPLQPAGFPGG